VSSNIYPSVLTNLGVVLAVGALLAPVDAAEPIRLTQSGNLKFTPQFLDRGERLAFVEMVRPNQFQLRCMDSSRLTVEPFHADDGKHEFDLTISRDGAYYAFVKGHGALELSLQIHDAEHKKVGDVPHAGGFAGYLSPEFAPDNSRLLFVFADPASQQHIYSVTLKGDDKQQLTDGSSLNNWPHFSPDGSQIVFGSTRDGNFDIYLMLADGSSVQRLTTSRTMDVRPEFSPDGRRICFTSNRDGNYEIYVMNVDGTQQRRVTHNAERDDYAIWHPDGKRLAIVSERSGKHDLYLIPM
jgi:WD40 repeat protein